MKCSTVNGTAFFCLKKFGIIIYAVIFAYLTYNTARHANRKTVIRNIACHNTAGADNAVIPNGNSGTYGDICSKPTVIADTDGLGIANAPRTLVGEINFQPFIRQKRMKRRDNRNIRTEITVIADCDKCVILNSQIEIGKQPVSYPRMAAVMNKYRSLKKAALSQL